MDREIEKKDKGKVRNFSGNESGYVDVIFALGFRGTGYGLWIPLASSIGGNNSLHRVYSYARYADAILFII